MSDLRGAAKAPREPYVGVLTRADVLVLSALVDFDDRDPPTVNIEWRDVAVVFIRWRGGFRHGAGETVEKAARAALQQCSP